METTVNPDEVIYPEILFAEDDNMMVAWTRIRKRSNGKYYFWDYKQIRNCEPDGNRIIGKEKLLTQLHFEVYLIQAMGKINSLARKKVINEVTKEEEQIPLFEKDPNQTSEERRLIEKYHITNQFN